MVDRFIDLFKTGDTNKFIKNNPIEIVSPTERYKLVKYLSSGTYGDVFSAVNTKGQKLAVKITPLLNKSIREVWETLYANKECKVFVIDLIEAFIYKVDGIENTTWVVQIQELMEGDITRLDMDYNEISKLFVFLLQAINCLHKNGIAHLDVTTSNIFYKDGRFKLADFGLSCFKQEHTFNLFGKSLKSRKCKLYSTYIPPFFLEKKLKEKLSFEDAQKLDVWSIGVTIYKKMSDASIYNKKDSMMLNRLNYGNLEYIDMKSRKAFLQPGDKIDLEYYKVIKNEKIPLHVFKILMDMILNEYRTLPEIMSFLEKNINLKDFSHC